MGRYSADLLCTKASEHGTIVTPEVFTAVTELDDQSQVKVYPSPVQDVLHIKWNDIDAQQCDIYTTQGALVERFTWSETRDHGLKVNTQEWAAGMYLVQVYGPTGILHTTRIIKQ